MKPAVPLLRLGIEVLQLHNRSTAGSVTTVPILVQSLDVALPALRAFAELSDGCLLCTEDDELQVPVPSTTDAVRLRAVEEALATTARRVVLHELVGGVVDAEFDPSAGADPSQGERTILALARAALHQDLDVHELAIIALRGASIDRPFQRAVWSLVTDQLAGMSHTRLTTLVVVVEMPIDVRLHCETGRGFRFAIEEDRLIRRHGTDDLRAFAARVARYEHPFVVFLGAGFSFSSRLPLGNEMRDAAIRRLLDLGTAELTPEQLAVLFHRWIAQHPGWLTASEAAMPEEEYAKHLTLEQVIRAEKRHYPDLPTLREFRAHHDAVVGAPGSAVLNLAAVLERNTGKAILVEVNFDRLVETHATVPLRHFSSEEDFVEAAHYVRDYLRGAESDIPLLKLHGDINQPETCVVSEAQTEHGIGNGKLKALQGLLGEPDEPRLWMYVGASLRDRDLLPVLQGEEFARRLDERWIAPYLVETVESFAVAREPHWRLSQRGLPTIDDRLVTETADAFFAAWRSATLAV